MMTETERDEIVTKLENTNLGEVLSLLEEVFISHVEDLYDGSGVLREHRQVSNETKAVAILALLKA